MVGGSLGRSVGGARRVRRRLARGLSVGAEIAEDLVRRYVQEPKRAAAIGREGVPVLRGGLEQPAGTDYVGLNERFRAVDGAVDVALGGEVYDGIGFVALEDLRQALLVADVGLVEGVTPRPFRSLEGLQEPMKPAPPVMRIFTPCVLGPKSSGRAILWEFGWGNPGSWSCGQRSAWRRPA